MMPDPRAGASVLGDEALLLQPGQLPQSRGALLVHGQERLDCEVRRCDL